MILPNVQLTLTKLALGFSASLLVMSACFFFGMNLGQNNINVRWQQEKLEHAKALNILTGKIQAKEFAHRQESVQVAEELRKTEGNYEKAVADLRVERRERLQLSAERSAAYKRLAEAGPAGSGDLASHAAKLDGALEEGRSLVGELQAALGQREDQLRLLGAQIVNDRKILDGL